MTDDKKTKKVKKKGPLRTEAIIPITLVVVLFGLYFRYYFDSHLRYGIEYAATQSYGAEINVGRLRTDFLAPSLSIYNIQVTDKKQPELNILQVGEIRLNLLWDGLLRGKFVIPESSILKIQTGSKRRRPGRILPPSPKKTGDSAVTKAAEKTLMQLEEKNKSNLLADVFAVAGGTDVKDQLKKFENELGTQKKIKALGEELKVKEQQWKKKIDELPDESELKQLVKRVEGLKIDTKNPQAIANSLKEVDRVYKDARKKYKDIEGAKKALDADLEKYRNEYKSLEKLVQEDINGITEKLNIPSLDPQEINKMLLGNLVASQLGSLYKYKDMAREYMPTKTAQERKAENKDQSLTPRERANGVNFKFPKMKSYPLFWLKKAQVTSTSEDGIAGDLSGTLANLTDNPRHLGIPTTFDFKGGFPHQKIMDVVGQITIDHTTEVPVESGKLKVGSFPVQKNSLTKSKDVELGYNKADGSSEIAFTMKNQALQINSQSLFSNVEYYTQARDPNVARLLTGVTQGLNNLTLNIRAKGSWDDIDLNINSNLGQKLVKAIRGQITGEINKARKQVENHVRGLVSKETGKLNGQLGGLEKVLGGSMQSRQNVIKNLDQTVAKKKNEAKKQGTKKIEKKLENKAKDLLKKIKF
jgi:uncharacterized protein (TIGR03545 family)